MQPLPLRASQSVSSPAPSLPFCQHALAWSDARGGEADRDAAGRPRPGMGVLHADLKARLARPRSDEGPPPASRRRRTPLAAVGHLHQARLPHEAAEGLPPAAAAGAPAGGDCAAVDDSSGSRRGAHYAGPGALFRRDGRKAEREWTIPTLLTEANRKAGRDVICHRPRERKSSVGAGLQPACHGNGVVLLEPEHAYGEDCVPDRREECVAIFVTAVPATLARLQAEGFDPAHGGRQAVSTESATPNTPERSWSGGDNRTTERRMETSRGTSCRVSRASL